MDKQRYEEIRKAAYAKIAQRDAIQESATTQEETVVFESVDDLMNEITLNAEKDA